MTRLTYESDQGTWLLPQLWEDMYEWLCHKYSEPTARLMVSLTHPTVSLTHLTPGPLATTSNLHIDFDSPSEAMLFKLTWGGK